MLLDRGYCVSGRGYQRDGYRVTKLYVDIHLLGRLLAVPLTISGKV